MKTFLAAFLAVSILVSAAPAAPLDAVQTRLVLQLQQGDHAAEADAAAAKAQLATEHAAHLAAEKDAEVAQVETAKLGNIAATAEADSAKQKARGDALAAEVTKQKEFLAVFALVVSACIYLAGATLESVLRTMVSAIFEAVLSGLKWVRLALKAAFPTLFFWL